MADKSDTPEIGVSQADLDRNSAIEHELSLRGYPSNPRAAARAGWDACAAFGPNSSFANRAAQSAKEELLVALRALRSKIEIVSHPGQRMCTKCPSWIDTADELDALLTKHGA